MGDDPEGALQCRLVGPLGSGGKAAGPFLPHGAGRTGAAPSTAPVWQLMWTDQYACVRYLEPNGSSAAWLGQQSSPVQGWAALWQLSRGGQLALVPPCPEHRSAPRVGAVCKRPHEACKR